MAEISNQTMLLIAEKVKSACIKAAIEGYQNAAISGLCHEGASEASISAIRMVDLAPLIQDCILTKSDQNIDSTS